MRCTDCPICLSTLNEECVVTPCKHMFHAACIEHYFASAREAGSRARCPLCRGSVQAPMPADAFASSGLPIEVIPVPKAGARCHFDRNYHFHSLGSFDAPNMFYVMASNNDRHTPSDSVMWTVVASRHASTVHINFRFEKHVAAGSAETWLRAHGFARNPSMTSTRSSGEPNGPYTGPVFSKPVAAGERVELYGSAYWEGTYFVFVEIADLADASTADEGLEQPPAAQVGS